MVRELGFGPSGPTRQAGAVRWPIVGRVNLRVFRLMIVLLSGKGISSLMLQARSAESIQRTSGLPDYGGHPSG